MCIEQRAKLTYNVVGKIGWLHLHCCMSRSGDLRCRAVGQWSGKKSSQWLAVSLFSSIADAKSSQGKGDGTSASKLEICVVPETAMTCAIEVGYFVKTQNCGIYVAAVMRGLKRVLSSKCVLNRCSICCGDIFARVEICRSSPLPHL